MRFWSRILVALLAVLLGTTAWPASAEASTNSFVDDDNSRFEPFIEAAKEQGLIKGCNPPNNDRVCPHHLVTRGSMAIMVARAIDATPSSSDHFTDDDGHIAEEAIDSLIDAGVPMGCEKDRFCPERAITRGEMAALITRAFEWDRPGNPNAYVDLENSPFAEPLAKLAARGGLLACDAPVNERMCPDNAVRRDEAVFALVSVMGLNPAATAGGGGHDQPALDFGDGFYDLALWDGRAPGSRNRVSITSDGFQNTGLRVSIPEGSHFGADFKLHLDDAADEVPEQLFFRYYAKFDEDWRATSSGKLPGFSGVYGSSGKGGYRSSPSEPGWSARLMFRPNHTTDDRIALGYYVYHLGQERQYGDGFEWNEAGRLQAGDWYCLEGEVGMNTPGLSDGALRAWVDGTPAFDLSGLEFRRPGEPEIKIESFWFNVYYGGKPVAPQPLGLTIDEVMVDTSRVGCGGERRTLEDARGDFNGDGYRDSLRWGECPGGTCFTLETNGWSGSTTRRQHGDGAWFRVDSHLIGLAAGDVDGDGRADVVYPGRCDASNPCWRVHNAHMGMSDGQNWGDGGRFSGSTKSLIIGDWNGDGLDDLVYHGLCAEDARPCWRVHPSTGAGFENGRSWGTPPQVGVQPSAADVDGDGRDDLVYRAPCDESQCWFAQVSGDGSFGAPVALGPALEGTDSGVEWIDFDGDSRSDLVSWSNSADGAWVEVRYNRNLVLSQTVSLAEVGSRIENVALRRLTGSSTVQAVLETTCGNGDRCVENYLSVARHGLVEPERFLELRWSRPGAARIE
jgi:hypothetical protein